MKKIKYVIVILIIILRFNAFASSGPIRQDSIIKCNNKYYGNHGNPIHWHEVIKKDEKWVSISQETSVPACYIKKVNEREKATFFKCSDGDTARFIIGNEEKKVRFLAVDTPEIDKNEPFSQEAKEFTCNMLKNAKEIYLEYDSNSDKEDKYGRLLAFIHVDGELLQKKLIENGYAKVAYIYGDYEYIDELRKLEEKAKKKQVGIWQEVNLGDIEENKEEKKESDDNIILEIINIIIEIIKVLFDILLN